MNTETGHCDSTNKSRRPVGASHGKNVIFAKHSSQSLTGTNISEKSDPLDTPDPDLHLNLRKSIRESDDEDCYRPDQAIHAALLMSKKKKEDKLRILAPPRPLSPRKSGTQNRDYLGSPRKRRSRLMGFEESGTKHDPLSLFNRKQPSIAPSCSTNDDLVQERSSSLRVNNPIALKPEKMTPWQQKKMLQENYEKGVEYRQKKILGLSDQLRRRILD